MSPVLNLGQSEHSILIFMFPISLRPIEPTSITPLPYGRIIDCTGGKGTDARHYRVHLFAVAIKLALLRELDSSPGDTTTQTLMANWCRATLVDPPADRRVQRAGSRA